MKISVVIATCNGGKYLAEQLESICCQTLSPDEIVISDDCSTDGTLQVAEEFAAKYDGIKFQISVNPSGVGCDANFERAIRLAAGEVIYLADQDDVWMPEKVAENLRVFQEFPDIELVMTNGVVIDKNGTKLDDRFSLQISENESLKLPQTDYFAKSVYACLANGMCMCMKKSLLDTILPFPDSKTCHDRWIAFCAMRNNSAYYLCTPLVKYRIHDTNTSMSGNISLKKRAKRLMNVSYHTPYDLHNMAVPCWTS